MCFLNYVYVPASVPLFVYSLYDIEYIIGNSLSMKFKIYIFISNNQTLLTFKRKKSIEKTKKILYFRISFFSVTNSKTYAQLAQPFPKEYQLAYHSHLCIVVEYSVVQCSHIRSIDCRWNFQVVFLPCHYPLQSQWF
jgi:hypothetical protein